MKRLLLTICLLLGTSGIADAQVGAWSNWGNGMINGYGSFYGGYGQSIGQVRYRPFKYRYSRYWYQYNNWGNYRQVFVINGRYYYGPWFRLRR